MVNIEMTPALAKDKLYPETLYYAERVSQSGHQPVYKRLMPDGEPVELSPGSSQKIYNHSPDGFQWGYSGSGPAQLALALLLDATSDPDTAKAHYQQFKWEKVAGWGEKWSITRSSILQWLASQEEQQTLARFSKN